MVPPAGFTHVTHADLYWQCNGWNNGFTLQLSYSYCDSTSNRESDLQLVEKRMQSIPIVYPIVNHPLPGRDIFLSPSR